MVSSRRLIADPLDGIERVDVSAEYVSLKQLADELGMDRSHARRYVIKLGLELVKRRTPGSGGQPALTVSAEEADFVRRTREEQGFLHPGSAVSTEKASSTLYNSSQILIRTG